MNRPDHPAKVLHANVKSCRFSKHTVVELLFVLLCELRSLPNALTVLFFGVATPHSVDGLLAGKEVICVLKEHASVADIDADLVVLALAVTVSE